MKNLILSLVLLFSLSAQAVTEVKSKELEKAVNDAKESVVVVDVYADWCGACKKLAPMLDKSEKKFEGKIKFLKMDVEKNLDLKGKVRALPTVLIFKKVGTKIFFGLKEGAPSTQAELDKALQAILDQKQ